MVLLYRNMLKSQISTESDKNWQKFIKSSAFEFKILNLFVICNLWFVILATLWFVVFGLNEAHAALIGKPPTNLGLVGYWSMNEGTGSYADDSSGNKNTGTLTNGPTWVDGKRGKALSFDGVDDLVDAGSQIILDDIGARTISAWIRPNTLGESSTGRIIHKSTSSSEDPSSGWFWRLVNNSGVNAMELRIARASGDMVARSSTGVSFGAWQHVVVTWDGSTLASIDFYINGVATGETFTGTGGGAFVSDADDSFIIGNNPGLGRTFDGLIDDVRVYNRALSAAEIQALYKSGSAKLVKTAVTNPITAKLLTSGTGGGVSSDVTASFTPSANALVLAFVYTLADVTQVPTMSGNGLTWVRILGPLDWTGSGTISVFRAMGAAPSSGAATISYSVTSSSGRWVIIEFANVDTSGTNGSGAIVQTATNVDYGGSSVTATLAAFSSANNVTVGGAFKSTAATAVAGSGFSLLGSAIANARGVHAEWKSANDTSVDMSFDSTSNQYMWAAEIKGKPGETKFAPPSNTGLVGYWSFDDGAGTSATDFSGKNNAGILLGGPTWVDGKRGKALSFDGSDDEVGMNPLSISGDVSVTAWIYLRSYGGGSRGRIAINQIAGGGFLFYVDNFNTSNGISAAINGGTQQIVGNVIGLDRWYHVVFTHNGANTVFYVNGVQVAAPANAVTMGLSTNALYIGGQTGDTLRQFDGLIDDVRIYNRVLSAAEVQALYNSR